MSTAYTLNADGTLATVVHNFRTDKQRGKREPVKFTFKPIAPYGDITKQVATVLNEAIAQHGKSLILENGSDWAYVPPASELTLDSVYTALTTPSARGNKLVNKETLTAIATVYQRWAVDTAGKSTQQAQTGASLIIANLRPIMGNMPALQAMQSNLAGLAEYIVSQPDELDESAQAALIRVIENLDEMLNPQITADSL